MSAPDPLNDLEHECRKQLNDFYDQYDPDFKFYIATAFDVIAKAGNPKLGTREEFELCSKHFLSVMAKNVEDFRKNKEAVPGTLKPDFNSLPTSLEKYFKHVSSNEDLLTVNQQGLHNVKKAVVTGVEAVITPLAGGLGSVAHGIASSAMTASAVRDLGAGDKKKSWWQRVKDNLRSAWETIKSFAKEHPVVTGVGVTVGVATITAAAVAAPIVIPVVGAVATTVGGAIAIGQLASQGYNVHKSSKDTYDRIDEYAIAMGIKRSDIKDDVDRNIELLNQTREEMAAVIQSTQQPSIHPKSPVPAQTGNSVKSSFVVLTKLRTVNVSAPENREETMNQAIREARVSREVRELLGEEPKPKQESDNANSESSSKSPRLR